MINGQLPVITSSHNYVLSLLCVPFLAGMDRVNFLSGSWCNAVFWIWYKNSVDNILMFLVVVRQ